MQRRPQKRRRRHLWLTKPATVRAIFLVACGRDPQSLAVALGVHGDYRHRPHVTIGNLTAGRGEKFLEMSSFTMGGERSFVVRPLSANDAIQKSGLSAIGTAAFLPAIASSHVFSAQTTSRHASRPRRYVMVADHGIVKTPLSST